MSVKTLVENFVKVYNAPGSDVYPLIGDDVDWIEMPSGRRGGRAEFFDALRQSRTYFTKLHLDVLSITVDESNGSAVLESELTLTTADEKVVRCRTLWFLGFKDGKIVKEHDYSIVLK